MQNFDRSTEFGARVDQRLHDDPVGWLTTIGRDGTPQPSPIWFLWDGEQILIYSMPETPKLRNIERQPNISFHLNSDEHGGNVVVITGEAQIDRGAPPASSVPTYVDKYGSGIATIGMTPESFAEAYSVAIRIRPAKLRGH